MASEGAQQPLEDWLRDIQLPRFFGALTEEGVEDITFLRSMDSDELARRPLCPAAPRSSRPAPWSVRAFDPRHAPAA